VFGEESLKTYIAHKRKNESVAVRLRPNPNEFAPYYDISGATPSLGGVVPHLHTCVVQVGKLALNLRRTHR
jgi:hypothetical protein